MKETEIIFFILKIWGSAGLLVALVFLLAGIDRIDEDARGAYIFRPLLIPGIILIWPLVLWRWFVLETGRDQWRKRHLPVRNAHFLTALIFALAVFVIVVTGFTIRQQWPSDYQPQKISLVKRSLNS